MFRVPSYTDVVSSVDQDIKYISTRGDPRRYSFEEVVLAGFAPDGGLFVPERIPVLTEPTILSWQSKSYTEICFEVLSCFIPRSEIPEVDLKKIVNNSFKSYQHPETCPLHVLSPNEYVLELFHGPTLAFKDVAMGVVMRVLDYFLQRRRARANVLLATSGDTGPAALAACAGLRDRVHVWCLYPTGRVSAEQELQMVAAAHPNAHTLAVANSDSDVLDRVLKGVFDDPAFVAEHGVTSVNSVNWARVMAQTCHFFHAYLRAAALAGGGGGGGGRADLAALRARGENLPKISFSVPTGAFGHMTAAYIAKRMGLPIEQFIVATNQNTELEVFFNSGSFIVEPVKMSLSNAIDIAVPYNIERFLFLVSEGDSAQIVEWMGLLSSKGKFRVPRPFLKKCKEFIVAYSANEEQTKATVRCTWEEKGYLLDPHTAVGLHAARSAAAAAAATTTARRAGAAGGLVGKVVQRAAAAAAARRAKKAGPAPRTPPAAAGKGAAEATGGTASDGAVAAATVVVATAHPAKFREATAAALFASSEAATQPLPAAADHASLEALKRSGVRRAVSMAVGADGATAPAEACLRRLIEENDGRAGGGGGCAVM